jgi:hypothetical protein
LLKKLQVKITSLSGFLTLTFTILTACNKNNNANPAILKGTWKLLSTSGRLYNVFTFVKSGTDTTVKQTETLTYHSTSTSGYITFSDTATYSDSIYVQAAFTQNIAVYINDVLNQDTTKTFEMSQNTVNIQSNFEIIGQDSIHISGPGIPLTNGLKPIGGATGMKFNISGNILTLTSATYTNDSSSTTASHGSQSSVVKLSRE